MNYILSDSSAHSTGADSLWEKPTFEQDSSRTKQITDEWIQSLSPELKDAALLRFCKIVEAKPTIVESFTLNQVLYRTISGNTFTESAESVAERTGCDRKTIFKGLNQAVEQNILEKNKRAGTSNEYSFKPVEEWLPQSVVRNKDTQKGKIVQFPNTENLQQAVETEPVRSKDDPEMDANKLFVVSLKEEQTTEEVSVPVKDTPSIWRCLPDGSRYAQVPPIHDQEIGVEIQRQMDLEGLTAQSVVGRAIAFSKAPLILLELLANIVQALIDSSLKVQPEPTIAPVEVVVSLQLSKILEIIGVNLSPRQLQKCVTEYGEDVMLSAANELKRTGVLANKENPTGYFLGCLKNGMGQKPATIHQTDFHHPFFWSAFVLVGNWL